MSEKPSLGSSALGRSFTSQVESADFDVEDERSSVHRGGHSREGSDHVRFAVDENYGHHGHDGDHHRRFSRKQSSSSRRHSAISGEDPNAHDLTYFSSHHPRDIHASLAVHFQEASEHIKERRQSMFQHEEEFSQVPMKEKGFTERFADRFRDATFVRPSMSSMSVAFLRKRKPRPDDKFVEREVQTDAHQISLEELSTRLETDADRGLSAGEVRTRLDRDGPNALTPPVPTPKWKIMVRELLSPFAIVMWGAAALCFIAYGVQSGGDVQTPGSQEFENLIVGAGLVLVVVVTAIFSFWQTVKGTDAMTGFAGMAPQFCVVIRDGDKKTVSPKELVVGDLVEVKSGDNIPADLRLTHCVQMKVDNSALTGESDPQGRSLKSTNDNPLETANLAFSGTSVVEGSGQGIVIHTGDDTVIGQLAGLVSGVQQEETPLNREIKRFVFWITVVAFSLAAVFMIAGIIRGDYWPSLLVIIIGIIVGTVPEGLPSAVAVSLALAAKRMAAKNVLVTEQLAVVETLGRTTVIASDKTGTLTQNRMTVSHVWCDERMVDVRDGEEKDYIQGDNSTIENVDVGQWLHNMKQSSFNQLYLIGTLCSRAVFEGEDEEEEDGNIIESSASLEHSTVNMDSSSDTPIGLRKVIGDASESGILRFCEGLQPVEGPREAHAKVVEIPFNSTNKYQVSIHIVNDHPDANFMVMMKGAPERIISRCTKFTTRGRVVELNDSIRGKFDSAYDHMGGLGERVLGFCMDYLPKEQYPQNFAFAPDLSNVNLEGMTFAGLLSMIDPPRDSVPGALDTCRKAGIKVAMVTGDHPKTAAAIARKIGLLTRDGESSGRSIVIHGDKLRDMSEEELDIALTHDEIVFARTSPAQKLRIVEGLQRAKQIVAVTGDGVNDSPALKQANVGVAMGIAGTDVSKDASDIILLDDNFGSIVNGIAEGRVIFDNLKKSIAYTLSSKWPQLLPFLLSFFLSLPPPLNALLILCIDIGTDLLPAISLAYEQAEANVMKRQPRGDKHRDRLVNVPSIVYSYGFLGNMQILAAFVSYFVIFSTGAGIHGGGFGFTELWLEKGRAFMSSTDPIVSSSGDLWSLEQRHQLAQMASTAYFATLLHVRIWVLLTCKTVEKSLLKHGLGGNRMCLIGVVQIICIPIVLSYLPGINWLFYTAPLPWYTWPISVPFGMAILALDEGRKALIRNNKRNALGEFFRY